MADDKRVNPDTGVFEKKDMLGGWHPDYGESDGYMMRHKTRLNPKTGRLETGFLGSWFPKD